MKTVTFSVDPEIFRKFSGVKIGVLFITGMDNTRADPEIVRLLRSEEARQKQLLSGVELGTLPEISSWRTIYRNFGSSPKDYRSSVEAMLRRARGGEKPVPSINPLVDLYNYISLKYHLPVGAEDLDKTVGDISLTFAEGSEAGKYIGGEAEELAGKGEVIYKDEQGFICRRWNWREADRTKIEKSTVNAILVVEKAPGLDETNFISTLEETQELVKKFLKAQVRKEILGGDEKQNAQIEFTPRLVNSEKDRSIKVHQKESVQKKESANGRSQQPKIKFPEIFSKIYWESANETSHQIKLIIFKALKEIAGENFFLKETDIKIDYPRQKNYGDFASNISFSVAGRLKRSPKEVAQALVDVVNTYIKSGQKISNKTDSKSLIQYNIQVNHILENVIEAGNGFLNMTLSTGYFITQVQRVIEALQTGKTIYNNNTKAGGPLTDTKVMVEYTDPNPFKEFHIGHLYSNIIGESMARIFESLGADIWRADFYGDVGMHVAKSVWGMIHKMKKEKITLAELKSLSIKERQQFLGKGYALGVIKYEEDEKVQEEIKNINILIYISGQELLKKTKNWQPIIDYRKYIRGSTEQLDEVMAIYEAGLRWSLEYFESIYKILGTKFDGYYPESWVGEYGMKIVEKGLKMGVLERSEGGVIYRGEQDGLHTRVFVNKLGLPTYEAKDLGLAYAKYQDFRYDYSLNVFGKEIDEYYKVVKAAMLKIEPELGEKAFYLAHGMVRVPEGKMSSRTGNVITFENLISEAEKIALKIMKEVAVAVEEKHTVAKKVGLGAVRYALLRSNIGVDVVFDFAKSISFEGDSGPYLMYTYARGRSVLRKAENSSQLPATSDRLKEKNIRNFGKPETACLPDRQGNRQLSYSYVPNEEELDVLRALQRFPGTVAEAGRTLSPNIICGYLYDLAQKYNLFYNKHSILNIVASDQSPVPGKKGSSNNNPATENRQLKTEFRLFLTEATTQVLKRGLNLLGIETVERM